VRADLGQRDAGHEQERRERGEAQRDGGPADDGEARAAERGERDVEDDDGGDAGPAAGHGGDDAGEVVCAERRERGAVDGAGDVLPRAHERARERAEGAVGPEHEAAVAGHGGGELRGDERLRDGPDEGEDEEAQQREERARGLHRRLRAVGPTRDLEEDEEDERHQGQLLVPAADLGGGDGGVGVLGRRGGSDVGFAGSGSHAVGRGG
jgi:hypothetical protein